MRKLVFVLLVLLAAPAFAQRPYFGASSSSVGVSFAPSFVFGATFTLGVKEVAGPLGLRGNLGVALADQASGFSLGADALFPITDQSEGSFYAGGGLAYLSGSLGSTITLNTRAFLVRGVVGYEARLARNWGLLIELTPNYNFDSQRFGVNLALGTNIYF